MKYSPTKNAFYHDGLTYHDLSFDLINVDDEMHQRILNISADERVDFVDGVWVFTKIPKTLEQLEIEIKNHRASYSAWVNASYAETMRLLTGSSTSEERDTWPIQLPIAQVIVSGAALSAEDDALVSGILKTGETREAWAAKVVYKNRKIKELIGAANGLLRNTLDAIASAQTVEDLDAIKTEEAAKADAAKQAFLRG